MARSKPSRPRTEPVGAATGALDPPAVLGSLLPLRQVPIVALVLQWRQDYPNVRSGRASQEVFVELSVVRSCINVSGLSLERVLRATMDISAPAFSLPAKPQVGYLGYQCSQAPGRPFLHLFSSSRRPRRETECGATSSLAPYRSSSFVRARRPFLRPGLRFSRAPRGGAVKPGRRVDLTSGSAFPGRA